MPFQAWAGQVELLRNLAHAGGREVTAIFTNRREHTNMSKQKERQGILCTVRVRASAARAAEAREGRMGEWRRAERVGGQNDCGAGHQGSQGSSSQR